MKKTIAAIPVLLFSATALCSHSAYSQVLSDVGGIKKELPVIEAPARGTGTALVVLLSGDGGWATIEKDMTSELNAKNVSIVGLDLRSYLRARRRTPDDVARDVGRVMRVYSSAWRRPALVLVGFSRGAGFAPFIVTRLPDDLRRRLSSVAFVGLPAAVNMTFHWIDVVKDVKRPDDIPVIPELNRISAVRMLCVFGAEETAPGCRAAPTSVTRLQLPGGHHLDRAYRAVSDSILSYIGG
jgi:type IV secretory pathway VirJ component